jgi:transcriptional regulator with XRE-family HTH domain
VSPSASDVKIALSSDAPRVFAWATKLELVPRGFVSRFLDVQSYTAASRVVLAFDPLIHRYLSIIAAYDGEAQSNLAPLFHVNVANIASEPWILTCSSATAGLMTGFTAYLRDVVAREVAPHIAPLQRDRVVLRRLEPGPRQRMASLSEQGTTNLVSAALDRWINESNEGAALHRLERVQALFGLRPSELARVLGVSREGLRQWLSGAPISAERLPDIDDLYQLAIWFTNHIKLEALPAFVRRQIPALNYQSPLDWLAGKRHAELREVFERGFAPEIVR